MRSSFACSDTSARWECPPVYQLCGRRVSETGAPLNRKPLILGPLQNLYSQERDERVTLWRDVARLRSQLPEAAQTYLTAHRKLQLLDTPGGEAP